MSNLGIEGVYAANVTNEEAGTGCTAIVCPKGATGGVDVRGGAPATRETDLLRPEETVQQLHAVVLSGGSAFGLSAACGAAEELERRGIGFDVGVGVVPIVSSACVFDLACGSPDVRPSVADGAEAVRLALDEPWRELECGNAGAGCGCTVGKLTGHERAMKGGLGKSLCQLGELSCAAIAAVNACGTIVDPQTGNAIAGTLSDDRASVLSAQEAQELSEGLTPLQRTNTTISCVVTNARLSKAQATKVAQMAADGYAHAIRPTHTTSDGDTIFVMATGEVDAPVDRVGVLAAEAVEQAITRGARDARTAYGFPASRDLGQA